MRLTDNPCRNCEKRSSVCRLTCPRYKVYSEAKRREYARRQQSRQEKHDMVDHVATAIDKAKKRLIKYTPPKNG